MISHKEGALQAFNQTHLMNVGSGIVDENAGIHITVGINVKVIAPAGNTSPNVLGVILEINREDRLVGPDPANPVVDLFPLIGIDQQLYAGIIAHGHIMEEPGEFRPPVKKIIHIFFCSDGIVILTGIAGGGAERQVVIL